VQELPHYYRVAARGGDSGAVTLSSTGLEDLPTAAPAEFGGPGDLWSPESLLVASVANCFVLTFRAVARSSKLSWTSLDCDVEGVLHRVERKTLFTGMNLKVTLKVTTGVDRDKAHRLLEKSEAGCLITNSLNCPVALHCVIEDAG
jgi:organic hydroperoxide reductase OsmC/OhrA